MVKTEWTDLTLELRHAELHAFLKEVARELGTSREDVASWASAVHEKFVLIGINDVHDVVARIFEINDQLERHRRQMMFRNTLSVMCRLGAAHLLNSEPPKQ